MDKARAGDGEASASLGYAFLEGTHLPQDIKRGIYFLDRAACMLIPCLCLLTFLFTT